MELTCIGFQNGCECPSCLIAERLDEQAFMDKTLNELHAKQMAGITDLILAQDN